MFGLNKVTGRGRQTVEALKQIVENKMGVLSNVRSDSKTFSFPTEGEPSFTHTHTFKLENSTGVLINCTCAGYQHGFSISIKRGNMTLLEKSGGGEPVSLKIGFSIENGFIVTHYLPDEILAGTVPAYVPLTDGNGTFGDVTVKIIYSGAADSSTYVSNINVNFN